MRKVKGESLKEMGPEIGQPNLPRVYFDTTTLPEAKKWEIGKTYELLLEVKMIGMSQRKVGDKEVGNADFEVVGIEPGEIVKKGKKKIARYTETPNEKQSEKVGE